MTALISINRHGCFSAVPDDHAIDQVLHIGDFASHDCITQLLGQPAVRLKVDGFSDGRGLSVARQLRLFGFTGVIEVIGDLLPDQLPMAVASGIDAIFICAEHAERCVEAQWRRKSADKDRFGYQRSFTER
ncbi:MAG: hypothetical protein CBC82_08075 [Cellvibrionales bacterium TMED122]|nr:hypothetical protein [Halieaceae bacterium]OUV60512.1 MAG: hypothetical protein CBC82_08075 [Cellvibrionales bacterium TMED122]